MGMLPPRNDLGIRPLPAPRIPEVTPLDPAMQGGSTTYRTQPRGEMASEDRVAPRGPATTANQGAPAAGPVGNPAGAVGAGGPKALVTPNRYVDPLEVQRLLAKARKGYGGTFLTGPRGVSGMGGGG